MEAPSQMLENWCWTVPGLKRLSKHVDTGASLPDDLLQKMLRAKNVNAAMAMARQIYLASLDLSIHGERVPSDAAALQTLVDTIRPQISLVPNPPGANMLRNFKLRIRGHSASKLIIYTWAPPPWRAQRRLRTALCT